ncbi:hypothetical protein P171DRAFT_487621 [Karstenula rhodostoma CBS 690.94]|uniref:Uncharacterized protein n=1 Tax=Karstenula rhodostoma CBS 690.94 TaxID=1392251 RepID=A0A9P4PFV5_9PLEO|nr:hypothetical protein P171DRAFT_487621 [Karstenula rhodostoma CBS 690.94]
MCVGKMVSNLHIALLFGISGCAVYFLLRKITLGASNHAKSKTTKPPSDIDFIASIIRKRERTAREEADQLNKLKFVDTQSNGEFEDLPDSDDDRKARHVGSGRKYSYWANQARMRRKQAAAKRRLEALDKAREKRLNLGAEASKGLDLES